MPPKTNRLALRELRTLTSLLQAVLLALNHTGVAREVASLLQLCTVVASLEKSASDAVAKSASLAGYAAAIAASDYVEVTLSVGYDERSGCLVAKRLSSEALNALATVNGYLASAGNDANASNSVLATAGAVVHCFACH